MPDADIAAIGAAPPISSRFGHPVMHNRQFPLQVSCPWSHHVPAWEKAQDIFPSLARLSAGLAKNATS
ncbi:hypothetical protein CFR71_11325 [Novacetimonas pomaceti]|uniref:Uncharacterized protein n=1 Tax=Novacetimonas pomaceti TaxID=2021998 RepID=A0A318QCF5_9PROT|nr:hypothetical protein CFR71_11325 [Novacetimonas pomaceti]